MSQEIIDAVRDIEREKGIENGERSHTLLSDDDLDIDWSDVPGDQVKREDVTPENFGRIAAQTAKQVILQRIREAERMMMYDEYKDRESEVVTGIVQQAGDRNNVLVDLGKVEALLPRSEQVDGERYEQGSRIKAVITEVRSGTKGPQVILSRRDPELIKTLFELEVPEIADGLVEIRGVAREPGYRSKIDVVSETEFARTEAEAAFGGGEEEFSGRCAAILSTGKRCPNTALPGSKYCGIPAHRELAEREAAGEDVSAQTVQAQADEDAEPVAARQVPPANPADEVAPADEAGAEAVPEVTQPEQVVTEEGESSPAA